MKNVPEGPLGLLNANALTEFRGLNYMMGADAEAVSIANFMKHYNPNLRGPSTEIHPLNSISGIVSSVPRRLHNGFASQISQNKMILIKYDRLSSN